MAEKEFVRRTGECRVKLAPDMMERLDALATAHGFPVATMAAVAVAEWVNSKEQHVKNQKMMMLDMSRNMSGELSKILEAVGTDPAMQVMGEEIARKAQGRLNSSGQLKGASGG